MLPAPRLRPTGMRPLLRSRLLTPHHIPRPLTSLLPARHHISPAACSLPAAVPPPPERSLVTRLTTPIHTAIQSYGHSQLTHPWITQILTSMTINLLGDMNAQLIFSDLDYDFVRTARMMATGAILAIPGNEWYTRISYAFAGYRKSVAVAWRVGLSQLVFSPLSLIAFFIVQGVLLGMTIAEIKEKVQTTMPGAWADSLKLWPAVSLINFWFIPLEFRALLGGVASLGWNTWLSYLNARRGTMPLAGAEEVEVKKVVEVPGREEPVVKTETVQVPSAVAGVTSVVGTAA